MHYQNPELHAVRTAMDYGSASETAEMNAYGKGSRYSLRRTEKPQPR
jgi:hypothetical protein